MSCDIDIIFTRRDSVVYLPVEAVIERFDEEDEDGEPVRCRRGQFLAYVVKPDSTSADSVQIDSASTISTDTSVATATDTVVSDATSTDSVLVATTDTSAMTLTDSSQVSSPDSSESPTEFVLDRFEEVTLEIGLETSTRIEILSGLEPGVRVSPDPALIARKLKERDAVEELQDGD